MARRKRNQQGSFWIGYSDLMTSLFFVFLVMATALAVGFRYQASIYKTDAMELRRIREISGAAERLTDNGRFQYNATCDRYELAYEFEFEQRSDIIPNSAKPELVAAGREIERVLGAVSDTSNVRFKIIVEGRAARYIDDDRLNGDGEFRNKELSYRRALALWLLWKERGIELESPTTEVLISGAGFDGACRYPAVRGEEGKNKRIIVQVVPFLMSGSAEAPGAAETTRATVQ